MKNMKFEEVNVNELKKAPYNRTIAGSVVRRWAKCFNMKLVNTIIVSNRDGVNYVVDGQHRVESAKIKGVKTLPAIVHYGLTYEEEAQLFVDLNKERKGLLVADVFKGEVEAGNPKAIDLQLAINAAGYETSKGQGTYKVQALKALQKIYDKDGPEMVTEVLKIISEAYKGKREANGRLIILGVWRFVSVYHHEFGRGRLVNRLSVTPPNDIIRDARSSVLEGVSDTMRAGIIVYNIYNKGLSNKLRNRFQ